MTLTYSLSASNSGDRRARFSVELIPPSYGPRRVPDGTTEGASIKPTGLPTVQGPGEIVGNEFTRSAATLASCSVAGAGGHGYEPEYLRFDVSLPPRSTSTIVSRYRAGLVPWTDLDYRLRYRLSPNLITGGRGTITGVRRMTSPQPRVAGRRAVHITFQTTPRSSRSIAFRAGRLRLGRRLHIRGRTTPAIPGRRIKLRFARLSRSGRLLARGAIGNATVRRTGAFALRWRPPRVGRYEIWATYEARHRRLIGDTTCPRMLSVVRDQR